MVDTPREMLDGQGPENIPEISQYEERKTTFRINGLGNNLLNIVYSKLAV